GHAIEIARTHPDATPVESGIRAAGDHAAATVGDLDPVTLAPHPGEVIEVGLSIGLAVVVVPEGHRHRGHRSSYHQIAFLADQRLTVWRVRLDLGPQASAGDLTIPYGNRRKRDNEGRSCVGP